MLDVKQLFFRARNFKNNVFNLFVLLILLIPLILLFPRIKNNFAAITGNTLQDIQSLRTTTMEQRKLLTYGNRTGLGYGYLRDVTSGIPDSKIFPVTKYKNYTRKIHLFLAGHRHIIDDRILVGIDLPHSDLGENKIAEAKLVHQSRNGQINLGLWAFLTIYEYDTLTGFRLHFDPSSPKDPQNIKITLLKSPNNRKTLGRWSWEQVVPQGAVYIKLHEPFKNFSFRRGSLPFVIGIENYSISDTPPAQISAIDVAAIKIDLASYTVIHRERRCFTAIKTDFLNQIVHDGPEPWRKYIYTIKNV